MAYPRVVFVDGPTGTGKDFMIEKLEDNLTNVKELSVKVLRAVDYVLRESQSENRKYDTYNTPEDKVKAIFTGHILLLEHIDSILKDDVDHTDVVIVNRSFISFLIYNLWGPEQEEARNFYLNLYCKAYREILKDYRTLYLQLNVGRNKGISGAVDIILKRLEAREDGKKIDVDWIYKLFLFYHTLGSSLDGLVSYSELVTSSDSELVSNKFFRVNHPDPLEGHEVSNSNSSKMYAFNRDKVPTRSPSGLKVVLDKVDDRDVDELCEMLFRIDELGGEPSDTELTMEGLVKLIKAGKLYPSSIGFKESGQVEDTRVETVVDFGSGFNSDCEGKVKDTSYLNGWEGYSVRKTTER